MQSTEQLYELVLRDAKEDIFLVAVRRAIDTRRIKVEFDLNRGPGPHALHTLTISAPDIADLTVTKQDIPHDWLPVSTGFIDTRFSRLVEALLGELTDKAQRVGVFL
jgi:hypothetical protein